MNCELILNLQMTVFRLKCGGQEVFRLSTPLAFMMSVRCAVFGCVRRHTRHYKVV